MSDLTFSEAAERANVAEATLRKHAQRGKLVTKRVEGQVVISEEALAAYQAGVTLVAAGRAIQSGREIGNLFGNLPTPVRDAILQAMPTQKKAEGHPELVDKAFRGIAHHGPVDEESDDPHFGHPIGYQHKTSPRWKRINASTWSLGGATWSHNGIMWVGGGLREGKELGEGVSPAAPAADRRPLAPSEPVKR